MAIAEIVEIYFRRLARRHGIFNFGNYPVLAIPAIRAHNSLLKICL
jgi:hypothetical protein